MERLIAIRHAPTAPDDRCGGRAPREVTLPHADAAARILPDLPPIDAVWSSPSERCAGLAQAVAIACSRPHRVDPRLHEIDMGAFTDRTWSDIEREDGVALARWMTHWLDEGPPGGESARDVEARVRRWRSELAAGTHLVIAHAGVVRALRVIHGDVGWSRAMSEPVPHLAPWTWARTA